MSQPREIRILKQWNEHDPGTVFTPEQADVSRLLVERKIAEYTQPDPPKPSLVERAAWALRPAGMSQKASDAIREQAQRRRGK